MISNLQTCVQLPPAEPWLTPRSKSLLLGSCFAQHVGQRMSEARMDVDVNPFGVLYNPESVRLALEALLAGEPEEGWVFEGTDGKWHSWMHSSHFSAESREACLDAIERRFSAAVQQLREASTVFVTWGTNRCYRLKGASGPVVANCHKEPARRFAETPMSVEQIVGSWSQLAERLPRQLRVVLTVSPYRYAKYGLHASNLAKSTLLLAIDALCSRFERFTYFPAYEIVVDELRDYRFYAPDMLHVSDQTADYVWERLRSWAFTAEMNKFADEWAAIRRRLLHRPQFPDSPEARSFCEAALTEQKRFEERWGLCHERIEPECPPEGTNQP